MRLVPAALLLSGGGAVRPLKPPPALLLRSSTSRSTGSTRTGGAWASESRPLPPLAECEVVERVRRASAIAWVLAVGALALLLAVPEHAQGFVGAVGAMFVFGASSLPAKHPAASAAGPLGFQLWVTLGNAGLNALLLVLLRVPARWDWWGVAGALVLTATQVFAWPAIQALGAAAGPGIWCGIGMTSSFAWGVAVFGETLRSPSLATAALLGLVVGVAAVAGSQAIAQRRSVASSAWAVELTPAQEDVEGGGAAPAAVTSGVAVSAEEGASTTLSASAGTASADGGGGGAAPAGGGAGVDAGGRGVGGVGGGGGGGGPKALGGLAGGVACAVCTGLLDGSLMAPFSAFRRSGVGVALSPDDAALRYLGAFALGLPVVALPPIVVALAVRAAGLPGTAGAAGGGGGGGGGGPVDGGGAGRVPWAARRRELMAAAVPGLSCGGLWAAGNVLSVHATLRLGQAVGFPLTQVCVVVSALWGIVYFRELRDRLALALFAAASSVVLASAAALKLAGGVG